MARVRHRDFSGGLWLQGDSDGIPRNALRQARAIAPLRESHLKSRWGSIRIAQLAENAKTIIHYADQTILQVGMQLGFLVGGSFGLLQFVKPLGGSRLHTARATPTTQTNFETFPTTTDHLYIAGGGLDVQGRPTGAFGARKLDSLLRDTQWGIDPPKTTPVPHAIAGPAIPIASFNQTPNELWGEVALVPGTLNTIHTGAQGFDSNNKQQGSSSFILLAFRGLTYATVAPITFDATGVAVQNGRIDSSDEDWIQFWVFLEDPASVVSLDLVFDVTSNLDVPLSPANAYSFNGLRDSYSFHFLPADISTISTDLTGSGDHPALSRVRGDALTLNKFITDPGHSNPHDLLTSIFGGTLFGGQVNKHNPYRVLSRNIAAEISSATARQLITDLGTTRLPAEANAWKLMRVPKAAFHGAGKTVDSNLWGQIRRVYWSLTAISTSGEDPHETRIRIDDLALHFGVGMMGDYTYAYTYKNKETGTRSNPSPFPDSLPMVKGVKRQAVRVFGIQAPQDPQVDTIELWRTIGNGIILFKAEDIPRENFAHVEANGHIDIVADFPGMQTAGLRTAFTNPDGSPRDTQFLQDEILTFDNIAIPPEVLDVAGPHLGRLFLLVAAVGSRGRCYFTALGRMENLQGFVICTSDDDPCVRVVLWNGQVYIFSNAKLFEIAGAEQPISTEIYGVPGTQWPHTVVPTPGGIIYRAKSGLRRFTGNTSELLAPEAVLSVFLGESVAVGNGTIAPFDSVETVTAEWYQGEYWITNGTTTLAVNPETKVWREVGVAASAMLAHPDIPRLFLSANSAIYAWETPENLTDGGLALPFVVEVPGTVLENQSGATKFVQRLYLDCNTNGQALRAKARTVLHGDLDLGTITTLTRELLEVPLLITGDVLSVELSGQLTDRVELFGCSYDYHGTVGSDGSDT